MAEVFRRTRVVRFGQCDPAGIVYYPRYTELGHELVEEWFREGLGVDFHTLHEEWGQGFPTASLELDFLRPTRYGETLDCALWVTRLGESSLMLVLEFACAGEVRVRIRQRLVNVDYRTLRPGAMVPALRTQFARFLHAKDTP
ncbi:thioesterase family protein [Brachymonas denitrificans]|uniref:acyl-CoA thioesterase n=1 Tax=Brachymonas denitrificans TaxID=28220 RepID=UPI002AFF5616|nr:thioesterase family protein [Brachymonas denitrificans]